MVTDSKRGDSSTSALTPWLGTVSQLTPCAKSPGYNVSARTTQRILFFTVVIQLLFVKNLLLNNGCCPVVCFAVVAYKTGLYMLQYFPLHIPGVAQESHVKYHLGKPVFRPRFEWAVPEYKSIALLLR
jgi:hypothetical protein